MKSRFKKVLVMLLIGIPFLLGACSKESETSNTPHSDRIQIVATISQIGEPIEVIGGDRVEVESLMGPGVDPHLYKATQGDINKLQNADIILYSGLHLEGNMGEVFAKMSENKQQWVLVSHWTEENYCRMKMAQLIRISGLMLTYGKKPWVCRRGIKETILLMNADYFEENKQKYFSQLDDLKKEAVEKMSSIPQEQRVLGYSS